MKVRTFSLHCSSVVAAPAARELIHAPGRTPAIGWPVRASLTVKVTTASEPATSPPSPVAFVEKSMRTPSFSKLPAAEAGALAGAAAEVFTSFGPPICANAAEAQAVARARERASVLTVV
jgi:hypothetical protein